MRITSLLIKNFKSIKELNIDDIENALILVGKNSTGKTVVLHAILAVAGVYKIKETDYNNPDRNIEIGINLEITQEDLEQFHRKGAVSKYKGYDLWYKDFCKKLPSFEDGVLNFTFIANIDKGERFYDGVKKNNPIIRDIFPRVHFIDASRKVQSIQDEIFRAVRKEALLGLQESVCMFDQARPCTNCFNCIPLVEKKDPADMTIFETAKLLEYKLSRVNMDSFVQKLNFCYAKNSGRQQNIKFVMDFNVDDLLRIEPVVINKDRYSEDSVSTLSAGAKSIYILSLLEAYVEENSTMPCIIMMEDPEIYLHPQLQKVASEILYKLSKRNQVFFSTHSPNLIFNFNSKQIKQIVLDEDYHTSVCENTDIDQILNDLGYTANDFMNVNFVFIVEGKQDSNRLPLLLNKYYSEIHDSEGNLQRISIITTNSCTNIKTYANLKYMNKLYLRDQFLMIRDSDGKNPETLIKQLCSYYKDREMQDFGNLPRVQPRNVLILKYYSFENYFLNPKIMTKIGVIKSEEEFYNILISKFKSYLFKLTSVKKMREITGLNIKTKEDIKRNLETIKIYVR
ncbi:MAG: AAA family ATPase, partial [Lachnospiraceae bacterium]|nr:AAA family ATPase [Lachnospiraceae bacterium]